MINEKIILEFQKYIEYIKYINKKENDTKQKTINQYKIRNMYIVLNILKNYDKKIKLDNYEELINIKSIGKGTIEKIKQILKKGYIKEIPKSFSYQSKDDKIIKELEDVIGIGSSLANELYEQGIKSVKQLKEKIKNNNINVNDKIKLGLKYHNKVKRNIPRSEMHKINKYILKQVDELNKLLKLTSKNKITGILCGSYRREKPTSNDIDVLLTKNGKEIDSNYLEAFVELLRKRKFILDDITDKNIKTKYMGFCKLNKNPIRRIDIRLVNEQSYPYALMYFTGSKEFNQQVRSIAKSKGYKLSEYGLYKNKKFIKVKTENDIFKKLGLDYVKPKDR